MEILKLEAAYKDYIWGGTRLKEEYGKVSDLDIMAEAWELSCHKDGPCIILNGKDKGMRLDDYLKAHKEYIGTACPTEEFPILSKFLDAKSNLSIQVHPDDEYAKRVEGELGKSEMWYIMDATDDAFIYFGLKETISKDEFAKRIENNTVTDVLNRINVKKGDCFFIKAGTIHAVGAGCLICEIQENSNSTYRVYDYGRVGKDGKPRQLHIEKAKDVSNLKALDEVYFKGAVEKKDGNTRTELVSCEYFACDKYDVEKHIEFIADEKSYHSIIVLAGEGKLNDIEFKKGDSLFVPAGFGKYHIDGRCEVVRTTL